MAEDVVDFAVEGTFKDRASITAVLPLLGGQGYGEWVDQAEDLSARYGWDMQRVDRLLNRYGSLLGELIALIDEQPDLAKPLQHAPSYLRAEIAYSVEAEGVLHLDDVMARRTRLSYESGDRGLCAAQEILQIAAPRLGWSDERSAAEQTAYRAHVEAVLEAETVTDDAVAAELISAHQPVPNKEAGAWRADSATERV